MTAIERALRNGLNELRADMRFLQTALAENELGQFCGESASVADHYLRLAEQHEANAIQWETK
jgi:hypothetical protein